MSSAIAISGVGIAATHPGDSVVWQRPLSELEGASWPSLSAALREGVASGAISSPIRIALLPPLVEVRSVSIPPVSEEDAKRLLTRAASRHFMSATEALTVGVSALATGGAISGASGSSRLAAAIPTRVLRAVLEAAHENALVIDVVVPAHVALSLESVSSKGGDRNAPVLAMFDDVQELITRQHATPASVRRFRRTGDDAALASALDGLGLPHRIDDPLTTSARALAASVRGMATRVDWPLALGSASERAPRSPKADQRSWWRVAGAATLLLGVVFMQELDVRRELDTVRAQRAALASSLRTLEGEFATADVRREDLITDLESGPRWSRVVADLSEALPATVYITRLRGRGDTLVVEGNAVQASAAYETLSAAPWVRRIVASAPVRRETADDGTVTERFEFTLTLRGAR